MMPRTQRRMRLRVLLVAGVLSLLLPESLAGYGVLSHEQLIDISWNVDIRPALLKRFPEATPEQVKEAHAYAYGGSVIQDLGYYPFGSHEFTNLLHYVRTGDFVAWMLRDAQNINEYAFALGSLSHYAADTWGHPAVNAGVAIEYPKLKKKFGTEVTYEDNPEAHLKTEFSFDVVQVAKRRYISKEFHDFIGFQVSEDLLERAFAHTYGITVDSLLHWDDLTIESYRFSVSRVIPEMTQVALATREHHIHEKDNKTKEQFLFHLSRADYEKQFGAKYRRPGIFARILAFFLRLIPKFGSFKALAYKDPTPTTEDLYFRSMNDVVTHYHALVQEAERGDLSFADRNLDTGELTQPGKYDLADKAYAELARKLQEQKFAGVTPALKQNIVAFFAGPARDAKEKKEEWKKTERALVALKQFQPTTERLDSHDSEGSPNAIKQQKEQDTTREKGAGKQRDAPLRHPTTGDNPADPDH
jgi:Zinc dependent phospholipase C